jgi:hypothetical protein
MGTLIFVPPQLANHWTLPGISNLEPWLAHPNSPFTLDARN